MSAPAQPGLPEDGDPHGDSEVVDALPVLVQRPAVLRAAPAPSSPARSSGAVIPAMQAAAVAAGGFVAGAAVVGLVTRRQRGSQAIGRSRRGGRGLARAGRSGPRAELLQVVSSSSFLVDVHVLGPASER